MQPTNLFPKLSRAAATRKLFENAENITESLNSTFPEREWKDGEGGKLWMVGQLGNNTYKLEIQPHALLDGTQFVNLTFSIATTPRPDPHVRSDWDERGAHSAGGSELRLFGCIGNAFQEKLSEYNIEFVTLVGKDRTDGRIRTYYAIASKLIRGTGLRHSVAVAYGEVGAVILSKSYLSDDEVVSLTTKVTGESNVRVLR